MVCRNCEKQSSEDAIYCTGCGEKLVETLNEQPQQPNEQPQQPSAKFKDNSFVKMIVANPIRAGLYGICIALFICTLNSWITISPNLFSLTGLSDIIPFMSGFDGLSDIIRTDFSAIDLVKLFFTMFQMMQGSWVLPVAAVIMIVGYIAIIVMVSVFGVLLFSNNRVKKIFGRILFIVSICVGLVPFWISLLLNNMISSMLASVNIPPAFLDVRIFTVTVFPYLIVVLSVVGLVLIGRLVNKSVEKPIVNEREINE